MRKIVFSDAITEESYKEFCEKMDALESLSKKPIEIEVCSGGGDTYVAFAFAARLRMSKCPITVTIMGQCQSAAVCFLLDSSVHRRMTKESWIMVHEDAEDGEGTTHDMQVAARQFANIEAQWNQALSECTKLLDPNEWASLHRVTTYFDAYAALDVGLVDEIV